MQEWTNPSFNVLVVQTPRPGFMESPFLNALRDTGSTPWSNNRFMLSIHPPTPPH